MKSDEVEVEIVLDEDELFEAPYRSGYRMKAAPRDDEDEEVTRRISLDELQGRLTAAGRK